MKKNLVMLFFLVIACEDPDPRGGVTSDAAYFPLVTGWYQLYDVEEIVYELGVPETLNYQLRMTVADSFPVAEGFTYVLHRHTRSSPEEAWAPAESWSATIDRRHAVVSEGNVAYVALSFPVGEGREWNGNLYNNLTNPTTGTGEDYYQFTGAGEACVVNGMAFADCAHVLREDNQEFIVFFDRRSEVYVRNVGLVFREKIQLRYCNDEASGCVGKRIIESGVIYRQEIVAYGKQ